MTEASDLDVNIDILDDDGLSQLRCRTCGKPVIGNLNGRGCPGCGWYIEQLVIDKDGWPVIVDGTPARGLRAVGRAPTPPRRPPGRVVIEHCPDGPTVVPEVPANQDFMPGSVLS